MRSISTELQDFLDTATTCTMRHLVGLTLATGAVVRWTDHTADIVFPGTVTVTAGVNDKVDFDFGGVRVATIAPGTYNPTTLTAAVKAALDAVVVPSQMVTVTAGVNDQAGWHRNGVDYSATVAPGRYTGSQLGAAIVAAMNGVTPGIFSYTWGLSSHKLTISCQPGGTGWGPYPVATHSVWPTAGFPNVYVGDALSCIAQSQPTWDTHSVWTVTASSTTGRVTISDGLDSAFSLKFATGANAATSARDVLGFGAVDTTSATSTTGTAPSNSFVAYLAGGTGVAPLVKVGSRRDPAGTEIGELEVTLYAGESAQLDGVRLPLAIINDALDGARVKVERVFGPDAIDLNLGTMHLFEGVVAEVEPSSTQVVLSLVDAREELRVKLPRTRIQPPCGAMLFDGQCSLSKASWTVTGAVVAGGDARRVRTNRTEADEHFRLGVIRFTSGANQGVKRAVRGYKNANGEFELDEALPAVPAAGDTFTAYPGCDKRWATCVSKFSNGGHHRGFPLLPAETTDTRIARDNPYDWQFGVPRVGADGYAGLGEGSTPRDLTLPIVYGRNVVDGTVIYRGGTGQTTTALMAAFCEGPIVDGRRFWVGSNFYPSIHNLDGPNSQYPEGINGNRWDRATLFVGSRPTQTGFWWLNYYDPSYFVTYPGTAYWADSYRRLPIGQTEQYRLEVDGFLSDAADAGADGDAHPASILADATYGLLASSQFGAGFAWPVVTDVGPDGTAASSARRYITAAGLLLSPVLSEPRETIEIVQELLDSCNCSCRMSDGSLEVVPLGDVEFTGNGVTFTPDTTVQYSFTEDHFVSDGEDPVTVKRPGREEVFNIVPVEFVERDPTAASNDPSHAYKSRSVEDPEPVDVAQNGPRRGGAVSLPMISKPEVALTISRLRAQQAVKRRNTYTFSVGYRYAPLEPLDYVALSDSSFGLSARVVRVKAIEEDEDHVITIEAEDAPLGMSHAVAHPVQSSESGFVGRSWVGTEPGLSAVATTAWTDVTLPVTTGWNGIAWSGARWVLVGNASACVTSDDPFGRVGWTSRTIGTGTWHGVASDGAGTVVAVGASSVASISADDGATWSAFTLPTGSYQDVVWDAAHGVWVAVGNGVCATSPTGAAGTWTARTIPAGYTYLSLAFNGSTLVACGVDGGTLTGIAVSSTDGGVTWTNTATFAGEPMKAVTALGSQFVLVGTTNTARASIDNGATWTVRNDAAGYSECIASDGYVLVALNQNATPCKVSTDGGKNWLPRSMPTSGFARTYHRVAFNGYVWAGASLDGSVSVVTVSQPRVF
jgi:uncharacterized phage protein (TIGR02218 family)